MIVKVELHLPPNGKLTLYCFAFNYLAILPSQGQLNPIINRFISLIAFYSHLEHFAT